MSLECDINITNKYYLDMDIAVIHKKPVSLTITKVDYKSRSEAVIKEAYFKTPSTTDYNGIYKGQYVDFEAKETKNKKFFPLDNIHPHQIAHLNMIVKHGGISFIIVRFTTLNLTFYLETTKLIHFLNTSNRKSIPLEYFKDNGYVIKDNYQPRVDYLKVIEDIYFRRGAYEKEN
jgi:recombination protein U